MNELTLTAEECKHLKRAASFADAPWCTAIAKLIRIHDALVDECAELRAHWKQCLDDRERVINLGQRQCQAMLKAKATIERVETLIDNTIGDIDQLELIAAIGKDGKGSARE